MCPPVMTLLFLSTSQLHGGTPQLPSQRASSSAETWDEQACCSGRAASITGMCIQQAQAGIASCVQASRLASLGANETASHQSPSQTPSLLSRSMSSWPGAVHAPMHFACMTRGLASRAAAAASSAVEGMAPPRLPGALATHGSGGTGGRDSRRLSPQMRMLKDVSGHACMNP